MHTAIFCTALVAALTSVSVAFIGCTANIHDNTVNVDATLSFKADADVTQLKPGDSVAVSMNATGVVLVDPAAQPAASDAAKASYFKVYLDDTSSTPLVVTAQASVQVKLPATTTAGKHNLICRLHKHDGTPTNQEQEISITVVASATVTKGDAGL